MPTKREPIAEPSISGAKIKNSQGVLPLALQSGKYLAFRIEKRAGADLPHPRVSVGQVLVRQSKIKSGAIATPPFLGAHDFVLTDKLRIVSVSLGEQRIPDTPFLPKFEKASSATYARAKLGHLVQAHFAKLSATNRASEHHTAIRIGSFARPDVRAADQQRRQTLGISGPASFEMGIV